MRFTRPPLTPPFDSATIMFQSCWRFDYVSRGIKKSATPREGLEADVGVFEIESE